MNYVGVMVIRGRLLLVIMLIFVVALNNFALERSESSPHFLFHDEFGITTFAIPEGWELLELTARHERLILDTDNPKNNIYGKPIAYTMHFGKAAEINKVNLEDMRNIYQEGFYLSGLEILYMVTQEKVYANLGIWKAVEWNNEATPHPVMSVKHIDTLYIHDKTIYVYTDTWSQLSTMYRWRSNDGNLVFELGLHANYDLTDEERSPESIEHILKKFITE